MSALYLDASALVKRYVTERYVTETNAAIAAAESVGTVMVSRAEVAAAFSKAARLKALTRKKALAALHTFRAEWVNFVRIQVSETVMTRADELAWQANLRGYDAVHLAAALVWQDALGEPVTFATFDQTLWQVAQAEGMLVFPPNLPHWLQA